MNYSPTNLLVTGAAGFIGSNFVHHWLQRHPQQRLIALDALTYAGNRASLNGLEQYPAFRFVQADICDSDFIETILRNEGINTIVHFAAESHVDRSIHGPDVFVNTNIVGTHSLLKAASNVWLKGDSDFTDNHRFHHVSTDEVYGTLEKDSPAFSEANQYQPNSPYAASKAASDHLVRCYHHTYGLQITTSNCSNNYGPFQFPEKLIPLIITNILSGTSLPVYGDGQQIRDWLYVGDHVAAIERILLEGTAGEVYNIGGNNEQCNIDIVRLICRLMREMCSELPVADPEDLITHVQDRPGHDRRYAINASKIAAELDFSPGESFESGFRKTVRWYLDNQDWWQSIISGEYRDWVRLQYRKQVV